MAIIRKGSITVTTGGTAQNLILGFNPSYIRMVNRTLWTGTNSTTSSQAEWWDGMADDSGYTYIYTAGASPTITYRSSQAFKKLPVATTLEFIPLSGLPPAAVSTNLTVTGISKAANASITATHAFTSADIGITSVTFHGIVGMTQMNTLTGKITGVTSTTSFTVDINSTSFTTYSSGGIANIITGVPATTTEGSQIFNTPQKNVWVSGFTLGTNIMVTTADIWDYYAILDTEAGGY